MTNQKPFLIAGSIALGIIALSLVFMAGRISANEGRFDRFNDSNKKMGSRFDQQKGMNSKNSRGGQMMNREMEFIDESALSAEQKNQLETIKKDQQTKMQELMQSSRNFKTTEDKTELTTQIEALWKTHMSEIRQFVSQDQLVEFDAFIAEGKPNMGMMFGGRGIRNK